MKRSDFFKAFTVLISAAVCVVIFCFGCQAKVMAQSNGFFVDIKANGSDGPVSVGVGAPVALTWTSSNATHCLTFGSWSGDRPTSGTETIDSISGSKLFSISCSGPGGSVSDSVIVNTLSVAVDQTGFNPSNLSAVSGPQVESGSSIMLTASASNSSNSSISYSWICGSGRLSGATTANPVYWAPTVSKTTMDTCMLTVSDGSAQSASELVSITVTPAANSSPTAAAGVSSGSMTRDQLIAKIAQIQSAIAQLQQQLAAILSAQSPANQTNNNISVAILIANATTTKPPAKNVVASGGDTLTFSITIFVPTGVTSDFTINNLLPKFVNPAQNLKINGEAVSGSLAGGLNAGNLKAGENTITFSANVASDALTQSGTDLVTAYCNGASASDKATINIFK